MEKQAAKKKKKHHIRITRRGLKAETHYWTEQVMKHPEEEVKTVIQTIVMTVVEAQYKRCAKVKRNTKMEK